MSDNRARHVMLFESASMALRAEAAALAAGFRVKLIATPRNLSSDCGVCLLVRESERPRLLLHLEERGVKNAGVYSLDPPHVDTHAVQESSSRDRADGRHHGHPKGLEPEA